MDGVNGYVKRYLHLVAIGWVVPGVFTGIAVVFLAHSLLGFLLGFFAVLLGSFIGVSIVYVFDFLKRLYLRGKYNFANFFIKQNVLVEVGDDFDFDQIDLSMIFGLKRFKGNSLSRNENIIRFSSGGGGNSEKITIEFVDNIDGYFLRITSTPNKPRLLYDGARNLENVCLIKSLIG